MSKIILVRDFKTKRQLTTGDDLTGIHGRLLLEVLKRIRLKPSSIRFEYLFEARPFAKKIGKNGLQEAGARLRKRLSTLKGDILVMGDMSYQALSGRSSSMNWAGGYEEWEGRRLMTTYNTRMVINYPQKYMTSWYNHIKWLRERKAPLHPTQIETLDTSTIKGLLRSIQLKKLPCAFDIETHDRETLADSTAIKSCDIDCIGFAASDWAVSVPWPNHDEELTSIVRDILNDASIKKVAQNGQFDVTVLAEHGIKVNGFTFDTMLAHAVLHPESPHNLGFIVAETLYAPRWKAGYKVGEVDRAKYNALDCFYTLKLSERLGAEIEKDDVTIKLYNEYHSLIDCIIEMKRHGCQVDSKAWLTHKEALTAAQEKLRNEWATMPGGEIGLGVGGNTGDLAALFFKVWRCSPLSYTAEGKPKFDDTFLLNCVETHDEPVKSAATLILKFRKNAKLLSTYVEGLPVDIDNRIHPTWNISGAVTGRWSSNRPNFQNIPPKMRDMFTVSHPDNFLVGADFSAIEARIAALYMGIPKLLKWLQDPTIDVHVKNAAEIFNIAEDKITKNSMYRVCAKTVLYGVFYNFSSNVQSIYETLKQKIPDVTYQQLYEVRQKFVMHVHPEIRQSQLRIRDFVNDNHYIEEPLSGRRRYFPDMTRFNINEALNFPIQGMASTIFNRAIRGVWSDILPEKGEAIIAAVHDAIYLEGPDPERLRAILEKHMVQEIELNGHKMLFTIDTHTGKNMKEL